MLSYIAYIMQKIRLSGCIMANGLGSIASDDNRSTDYYYWFLKDVMSELIDGKKDFVFFKYQIDDLSNMFVNTIGYSPLQVKEEEDSYNVSVPALSVGNRKKMKIFLKSFKNSLDNQAYNVLK